MGKYQQYFLFLRYSLQPEAKESPDAQDLEWQGLYKFSCEQAIAGVVFEGVAHLGEQGVKPPFRLLMEWLATAEQIKNKNKILNERCVELTKQLEKDGFQCCILKGQGNAVMYPNPYSRTPGDIDVWPTGGRERVFAYVRQSYPRTIIRYHHVDFPIFKDVSVEMHFMPFFMNCPLYNHRLQKWFQKEERQQYSHYVNLPEMVGTIPVPTNEFNIIYQMVHLMHHFFDDGIGLRQFVDYYFVLKGLAESAENAERYKAHTDDTDSYLTQKLTNTNHTNSYRNSIEDTLHHLGLWKFAGAVMYVMREVFALEERYMIAPVDERRGKTLLNEILKGGNFGQHSGLTNHSTGGKYFAKTWRNMKLVREYPAEALCEPVFRTWHFFWRLAHR